MSDKENNSKFMSIVLASIIRSVKKDISDKGIVYKLILDSIEAGFKTKLSKEYYKNKAMEADLELEDISNSVEFWQTLSEGAKKKFSVVKGEE